MNDKSSPAPCQLQPWDTEFFRCRIARVCGDTLNDEQALQIDDWSREQKIQALYFLSRADDMATIRTAEKHGFGLVDIRVTFDCKLIHLHPLTLPDLSAEIRIRPVQADDMAALQSIARTVHTDTRFFKDSHFPRQRAEDLYSTWIALETQGRADIVWVAASAENQPLGYISCHLDSTSRQGQIGLVGVSPQARRRGIGKKLVLAAMDWFRTEGVQVVTVVTQGDNRAAQRLYQQCGFLSQDLQIWYHKWYPVPG